MVPPSIGTCFVQLLLVYLLVFCHVGQIGCPFEIAVRTLGRFHHQGIFPPQNFLRALVLYILLLLLHKVRKLWRLLRVQNLLLRASKDLRFIVDFLLVNLTESRVACVDLGSG